MSYHTLSASRAMASLTEQCELVKFLKEEVKYEREIRDDLILDARQKSIGVSRPNLANITRLSLQQIRNIEASAYSDHYEGSFPRTNNEVAPHHGNKNVTFAATMAMASLRSQCEKVVEKQQELDLALAIRDDLIRDARAPGVQISQPNLAYITKLSVSAIQKIEQSPYSEHYDGPHISPD